MNQSENRLSRLLQCIGLPIRKSYNISEVCSVLGISRRTFYRLTAEADRAGAGHGLESVIRCNERRVTFTELAAFMARNQTFLG